MRTAGNYPTHPLTVNVADLVPERSAAWTLGRRLAWTWRGNPNHQRLGGARRRYKLEHELDEHLVLLEAFDRQGELVALPKRHKRDGSRTKLEPWRLLYERVAGAAAGLLAYRQQIGECVRWLRENAPAVAGWGMRQSASRAKEKPEATRYYLPRREWIAAEAWLRVAKRLASLLRALDAWWLSLIPVPRSPALRPKAEEQGSTARATGEAGTRYRDQSVAAVVAIAERCQLRFGM